MKVRSSVFSNPRQATRYLPSSWSLLLSSSRSVRPNVITSQQQQDWQPKGPTHSRFISSSSLTIEYVPDAESKFNQRPPNEKLVFGTTTTDHMLLIEWDKVHHWKAPKIVPYQNLQISPAASCLHYGLQCFEGMKAYKTLTEPQEVRLFRPDMNMKRLASSMERLYMPGNDFDHDEAIKCLAKLVEVDSKWILEGEGYSLYLRPTVIATHQFLGLAPPDSILFYIIMTPVGPYYKTGFKPVKLTADMPYVRAWPGGTGFAKVGGNYASTMKPQAEAADRGYGQVLWLFGENEEVTEVGSMNVFFLIRNKETGRPELVTAPLTRGDILPGVTRDSILHLARTKWYTELDVSERYPTMPEIYTAYQEGRLLEVFGAGTAAVVSPVNCIEYKGQDLILENSPGPLTQKLWDEITGIQYGTKSGPDGWSININDILK